MLFCFWITLQYFKHLVLEKVCICNFFFTEPQLYGLKVFFSLFQLLQTGLGQFVKVKKYRNEYKILLTNIFLLFAKRYLQNPMYCKIGKIANKTKMVAEFIRISCLTLQWTNLSTHMQHSPCVRQQRDQKQVEQQPLYNLISLPTFATLIAGTLPNQSLFPCQQYGYVKKWFPLSLFEEKVFRIITELEQRY